ncbi:MAG: hypothetical protein EB069_09565, partial [Actinobacteria bacterium]|nr:hypothetical protein [Actinomycetota bacterium]
MPRGNNELARLNRLREDEENKRLNLALRGREKVFGDEGTPNSTIEGNPCGPGYEWIEAPQSSGKTRHRAQKCCYTVDKAMEVLVIIMRDGSMIQYDGVDPVLWDVLKNSDSTHDFIEMYLDGHPWSKTTYSGLP